MSKRIVRADSIGLWFSQLKQGMASVEVVKQNAEYTGYFLYDTEVEELLKDPKALLSIRVQPEYAEEFKQYLADFNLVRVPKYRKGATSGDRVSLSSVKAAEEKGVSPENIEKYVDLMTKMYELKKEVETILNGKKIAISIPDRNKVEKESEGPVPEVAEAINES